MLNNYILIIFSILLILVVLKLLVDLTISRIKEEISKQYLSTSKALHEDLQGQNITISNRVDNLANSVYSQLKDIKESNSTSLEKIRESVNEKLETTLEKRLGSSFKVVSDHLEQVHKGVGNMQTLAKNVGDLKNILTNVKLRGNWGEVQLEAILSQFLSKEQYKKSFSVKDNRERVDFAINIPGSDMVLPIDSKFPIEDFKKIDSGEEFRKALYKRIKQEAKSIYEKYVYPPVTTDFAIMFLPTEGLYAEVLSNIELTEFIQREYRLVVSGPSTLIAILNSLRLGFQTVTIQEKSSEVWAILKEVRREFLKFGTILEKSRKKILEAGEAIEGVSRRSEKINRSMLSIEDPTIEIK